jgi:hypothetical protein
MDSDDDDERRELDKIEQTAREVLATIFTVADQITPEANSKGMLIGIAAIVLARSMKDGDVPGAEGEVNAVWAEEGFPWRMVRSLQ